MTGNGCEGQRAGIHFSEICGYSLNQYDTAADKYQEVVRRISELQKQGLGKKNQNGLSAPDFDKIAVQIKLEKILKHEQWESSSVLSEMRARFRR